MHLHTDMYIHTQKYLKDKEECKAASEMKALFQKGDLTVGVRREFSSEVVNSRALNRKYSNFHTIEDGRVD